MSPDTGRARSSSHKLTSRARATTHRGRQGIFESEVGSQTAIATGMVCPLRRDSTGLTDGNKSLYLVLVGVVFLSILNCF
jgi:hypothetical protein